MIRKIAIGFLVILLVIVSVTAFAYLSFRSGQLESLESGSLIADTSEGPVEYQIVGNSGPYVLYLHGTPGGYDQSLSTAGYRILAPSRPGYLRTPIEVGRTPAEQAQAYLALLNELSIESVIVMGASGGGPSAISFAGLFPERTNALVVIEAVSRNFGQEGEAPSFMSSDFTLWGTMTMLELFLGPEGIVSMIVSPQNQQRVLSDPDKIDRLTELMWTIWPISRRTTGQENDMLQFSSLDLPTEYVTSPTFIIHGTDDNNVPISHSEMLAQEIPHAVFHIVEGGDHYMPISHAEEVTAAIDEFLTNL